MAISPELQQRIRSMVRDVRKELYGEQGCPEWGTKFTEMERQATEIGDAITCELLRQALERQAGATDENCPCGVCQQPTGPHPDGMAPQVMTTGRGEVTWNAPQRLCDQCRQAFFPSASSIGSST
jgi:hypothetical protein